MNRSRLLAGLLVALPVAVCFADNPTTTPAPAAAATPAAATPAAPAASAAKLKVEIKLGTGLEAREVTGEAASFDASTPQIVGWTMIDGAAEPTEIIHQWLKDGTVVSSVTLAVKSAHYRTYSKKTMDGKAGSWTLQVTDATGTVLASKKFEMTSSAAAPAK